MAPMWPGSLGCGYRDPDVSSRSGSLSYSPGSELSQSAQLACGELPGPGGLQAMPGDVGVHQDV